MSQKDHAAADSLCSLFGEKDRNPPVFLLGAGASSPQVPLAREACEQIIKSVLLEHQDPGADPAEVLRAQTWFRNYMSPGTDLGSAFPHIVKHVLQPKARRRRMLRQLLHRSIEPNAGYGALAQLIAARKSRMVLTTNFDYCVFKALLAFEHTVGRPIEIRSPRDHDMMDDESPCQIVYLHGTIENYTDLNTDDETERLNPELLGKIWPYLDRAPLVVIGYGGAEKSIMNSLLREGRPHTGDFKHGLFWCTLSQRALHEDVVRLSNEIGSNMKIVEIDGFQETMIALAQSLRSKFPLDFVEAGDRIPDVVLGELRAGRPHVTVQHPLAPPARNISPQKATRILQDRLRKLRAARVTFEPEVFDRYLKALLAESKERARNYAASNAITLAALWKSRLRSVVDAAILEADFRLDPYPNLDLSGCSLDQCVFFEALSPVNAVAVSPGLRIFAAVDAEGQLHVWNFEGRKIAREEASREALWTVSIVDDRNLILTAGADGYLRTWGIQDEAIERLSEVRVSQQWQAAAVVAGDRVFAGGGDGILRARKLNGSSLGHHCWSQHVTDGHIHAIAAAGNLIAAGDSLGSIHLLSIAQNGGITISDQRLATGSAVFRLAFSADKRLLSAGCSDGTLHICHLGARTKKLSLVHEGRPTDASKRHSCLTWLDERTLLTGHRDGTMSEYSVGRDGTTVKKLPPCHNGSLLAMHAATGPARSLVTAGSDYCIRLHDPTRTQPDPAAVSIHGYCDWQNHGILVQTDSGPTIFSGGEAGKLWRWSGEGTALPEVAASVSGSITALACSERLKLVLVGCADGFVYLFRLSDLLPQSPQPDCRLQSLQLDRRVLSVAFLLDRLLVLTAERVICMDAAFGGASEYPRTFEHWHGQMEVSSAGGGEVALVPDGQTLMRFSSKDGNVAKLDDLSFPSAIRAVAASAGGAIACGHDGGIVSLIRDGDRRRIECGDAFGQINGLAFVGRSETLSLIGRAGAFGLLDTGAPASAPKRYDFEQVFHYVSGNRNSTSVVMGGTGNSVQCVQVQGSDDIRLSSRTVPLPYFGWNFARASGLSPLQVEELTRLGAKVQP